VLEVGGVNTLESNMDNITVKKFDLAFDVDPLFKKTSASFDEGWININSSVLMDIGGAKGLLINHLSVYNNCELLFDSSDAIEDVEAVTTSTMCNVADLQSNAPSYSL
jgi:condensin complex subunit 2